MTQNIDIPQGYKDSPLGIIPQEWEVRRLGDLGGIVSGLTYSPDDIRDNGILVLRSSNVQNRQLCFDDNVYVDVESFNPVIEHDILICVRNGSRNLIGKNTLITKEIEGVAFGAFMSVFRSPSSGYLFQLFDTDYFYKRVHQNLGATINSINGSNLQDFRFPIPPLEEQRRIAEVLGCWDEAIERQGRMVKLLTTRKRALMQQLLAPQSHHKVLKQLKNYIIEVSERKGQNIDLPVLSVTNSRGFINQSEQFDREVASADSSNYKIIRRGQFAYNPSRVNVGSLDLLKTFEIGILSPMYVVFQAVEYKLDSTYLYYLLKSDWFTAHIPMYVQGSVRDSLSFDGLRDMKFFIPSIVEQKSIAEKLSTADAQIDLARRRLGLLRTQKCALMQQLLTGKKRLK